MTGAPDRATVIPLRRRFRAAEFFAGIGLVRLAVEWSGGEVVFANDIEPSKEALYAANFGGDHFRLDDVRRIEGGEIPDVDLATASFPCTDLSLAGNRAGLRGEQSGMFWEFARVLREMGQRRPRAVLLENVPGFATSHGGDDLRQAVAELNDLGYVCDLLALNARHFVPQSRPRLFIVGVAPSADDECDPTPSELRPPWLCRFIETADHLAIATRCTQDPPYEERPLASIVERLKSDDAAWWDDERTQRFLSSLSPLQTERVEALRRADEMTWRTAYRRTRQGRAVWEVRPDAISGCLRTARGGSSKQALIEVGRGHFRVRWATPREYARLQGVPDTFRLDAVTRNQALFGLGDAVCVPAVAWVIEHAVPARRWKAAMTDRTEDRAKIAEVEALRRERDEARDEAARCRDARHKATRDAMDAAETWWRKRTGHYRPALEQITARYIAGASAGELADIAFEALEERTSP